MKTLARSFINSTAVCQFRPSTTRNHLHLRTVTSASASASTPPTPSPIMATRNATIPQATRMFDGNMDKSDVWSIFT